MISFFIFIILKIEDSSNGYYISNKNGISGSGFIIDD